MVEAVFLLILCIAHKHCALCAGTADTRAVFFYLKRIQVFLKIIKPGFCNRLCYESYKCNKI